MPPQTYTFCMGIKKHAVQEEDTRLNCTWCLLLSIYIQNVESDNRALVSFSNSECTAVHFLVPFGVVLYCYVPSGYVTSKTGIMSADS